jgi:hypothetical protein
MSVLFGVLEEEQERLVGAIKLYAEKAEKLPRGSLWVKKRGQREYAYLAYREGGKVHFEYVAPVPSRKYQEVMLQVKERNMLVTSIRQMRKDQRILERTLKHVNRAK